MNRPNLLEMNINAQGFFGIENIDATTEKLLLITGDNASGKSLLRRVIESKCHKYNIKAMSLSQERRSISDYTRAFIYGSEDYESTGQITARSIQNMFKSSFAWDINHILIIDEPEIGLSDESQLGLAQYIKDNIKKLKENVIQVVIFTHSKILIEELSELNHIYIHIGGKYKTVDEYINRKIVPVDPSMIGDIARANFAIIEDLIEESKEKKEKNK